MVNFQKHYDADITQTVEQLLATDDVKQALGLVKEQLLETIEIQKELALIEAPSFHEEKKAKRYAELLREAGLQDVVMDDRFNVWGRWPGSGNTGKSVLLEGHLDTVFSFGDVKGLTVDEEGLIHCPGICDDTRAIAANLSVFEALKTLGIRPYHDIIFAATVCEEGLGGMIGMKTLLQGLEEKTEVLATISIDGPTNNVFYANATGMVDWTVTFTGPGGHAWTASEMPSAIHAACRAASMIADIKLPTEPKTTVTVSLVEGGQAIHAIAQTCTLKINARSNSQEALERLNTGMIEAFKKGAELENRAKGTPGMVKVEYDKLLDIPAGSQNDQCRMIQATEAVTEALGIDPCLKPGGCTNANMAIAKGIPAVCLGRGGREYGTHTLNEWFDPRGVEACEQKSLLLLLTLAGLDTRSAPLADTLKS